MRDAEIVEKEHLLKNKKIILDEVEYILGEIYQVIATKELYIACRNESGHKTNLPLLKVLSSFSIKLKCCYDK